MYSIKKGINNKSKIKIFIFILIISSGFLGCNFSNKSASSSENLNLSVPDSNNEFFQEIGQSIGLNFIHSIGSKEMDNIIESVGGGTAFLDFDQDGFIDIFMCSGTWIEGFSDGDKPDNLPVNRLYRNLKNGTFEDVTEKAKLNIPMYSLGSTIGDYNNDGYPDIFISNYGINALFKNNGNGTFENVTKNAKIGGGKNECSVGAVWFDYDNDGLLDLYVGNYLEFNPDYKYFYAPDGFPGPLAYNSQPDILYHNNGDGSFKNVTKQMGIVDIDGRAMGVGAADYDDDGFMDIYVANDHTVNYLWHNNAGKGFTDRGVMSGTAFSQAGEATVSMAIDFSDYNQDGLLDMFISDDNYCSLYENLGKGVFKDNSYASGISIAAGQFIGWSSSFLDYDNDGDADIFKTNGELKHRYGQEDQLFENLGDGKFSDVSVERGSYFKEENVGRGACMGDYDNDGDIDIFITNLDNKAKFLRNNKGNLNNWITLNLVGQSSNRDGIGSRIKIVSGGKNYIMQKISTSGYLSQNDPRVHIGLNKNLTVESIEIKWPSGKIQLLKNVKINQILTIKEPI
ncbi:CRTAC1 family protein [Lutibacter sp.]|uniref:CRTAC1 family protein n=1 Tax=Lutibacter sp. TaxID=1925666 RepID=UPI00273727CD|nr:CRTAC1 family protein [Lutibacter sp.]MDP3314029.1 CRTAC1 family protein [Lutibacter sp.]